MLRCFNLLLHCTTYVMLRCFNLLLHCIIYVMLRCLNLLFPFLHIRHATLGLSKMSKLLLRQCNHSKGVFSVWKTVHGRGSIRVHTGGIDAYWTLVKSAVPNEISSNVGGKPNKNLWMYMRSQQWRWECHDKDLLALTGQTLATL